MEFWLDLLGRLAIVAVVTVVATFAWVFASNRLAFLDKPLRSDMTSATIRPWPPLWWVFALFLGAVAVGGAVSSFYMGAPVGILLMFAMSLGIGALAWMSLIMTLPVSWISWNESSVEGPGSSYGLSRRTLNWAEISKIKRAGGGNVFENDRGDRIVWTDFHIGGRFLWGFLLHKRPDLKEQLEVAAANG
jgi:hypothetical protein